ncbi:hypothetical protein A7A78_04880 [Aequorivita soesokkakensis]|uniref:Uncharacterized protein n=1 Tax=Aequorivita soesokkakensis TaxID=1385699 RepID=A0A1A9LD07_9FLAO|nr:hypothetical protein [Aequorivita soesokkakensis]OAD91148.1 hypothetical protein A7A78_04880 [Aequorivita soesokkakensis]
MIIPRFNPKSFLIVLLASAPLFISCKDKETEVETPNTVQEATLEQKKQALQNVAPTSSQTINNSATGDVAVNPPHGQPGHDCAIPVGAPLNGPGSATTPGLNKTNSVPPTISGGGVNPPHGQPGHRCDIKVGDPL